MELAEASEGLLSLQQPHAGQTQQQPPTLPQPSTLPQLPPAQDVKDLVTDAPPTTPKPRGFLSAATAAALVVTPAPGPDPARFDPRLTALVHGAFRAFLHRGHERALRLPDRYLAWLVFHLIHWTTAGLYGLPPPPVPDAELLDGLTRLVARFAAAARRRRRLLGTGAEQQGAAEEEDAQADAALRALERQLVEKALKDSRAVLQHPPYPPCGTHARAEKAEEEGGSDAKRPTTSAASSSASASEATSAEHGQRQGQGQGQGQPLGLVDRLALLDAACKTFLDFLTPADLAAAQQACRRWRALALPRSSEYWWNLLICQCWWSTFPSLDMARGCCMLEFLRRDATFSESLRASAAGRNPLIPTDQPSPSSPSSPLPPLPPAPRLPLPPPSADAAALTAYLGGFRVAVDVMDQARQAILASAVVELGDAASRDLLFAPVRLPTVDDEQGRSNTGTLMLQGPGGALGAWRFRSHTCAEQYFAAGPEAFRMEVMLIHPETHKVSMLLPSDERAFPPPPAVAAAALGLLPLPYTLKQRGERSPSGRRFMVAGTFHGAPVLDVLGVGPVEAGFELLVATQEEEAAGAAGQQAPQVVVTVPRVGLVLEAVALAEAEGGDAAGAEEEGGQDDEQSLPSLPPGQQLPQQAPAAALAPPAPPQQRAVRRRLEGEQLLRALGYVVPRLMWH